jgi:hypothetical protein
MAVLVNTGKFWEGAIMWYGSSFGVLSLHSMIFYKAYWTVPPNIMQDIKLCVCVILDTYFKHDGVYDGRLFTWTSCNASAESQELRVQMKLILSFHIFWAVVYLSWKFYQYCWFYCSLLLPPFFFPLKDTSKNLQLDWGEIEEVGNKCIQGCLLKGDRHKGVFTAVIW